MDNNLYSDEVISFCCANHEILKSLYNEIPEEEQIEFNFIEFCFEVFIEF